LKNYKPIIIVAGEPNSIFLEIFFKSIKRKKALSPIVLICSKKLLKLQMEYLGFKKKIRLLEIDKIKSYKLNNNFINLIDVEYNINRPFEKISNKSKEYIKKSFSTAILLIKSNFSNKLINGPISKKHFLNKNIPGITEFLSDKFHCKNTGMLIYNKELSVCPITTHIPLKLISNKISKKLIIDKVKLINFFYRKKININPKIAVLGLNPHCESRGNFNEEKKIIIPAINTLNKLKMKISGPYSADTIFMKNNRKKFNVIVGMYHDQVLTPLKTIFEYDAINITMGLPFIRISPDHGPNESMMGKNLSNPESLIKAISFLDTR
jgi:4-hydroxythreonine-4-phosphate dehydrogenase